MMKLVVASLVICGSPLLLVLIFMASEKLAEEGLSFLDQFISRNRKRPASLKHRPKAIGRCVSGANAGSTTRS